MRMLAYLLAVLCVIVAVAYYFVPAGSLPSFAPGYIPGSEHTHVKHAIAAAAAAIILFALGWFFGRSGKTA